MSSIICFDIRNFSAHVSYLSLNRETDIIFNLLRSIFDSLENAINKSRADLSIRGRTSINHTGDGFIAIFYGKGKSLQSVYVASLVSDYVDDLLIKYGESVDSKPNLRGLPSLDFGIGIHLGDVKKFKYCPAYPENYRISGFFGDAINISYRVQESTKDHIFKVICTRRLYGDVINEIKDGQRNSVRKYFFELGKHKLRGMSGPYTLYGVKRRFAGIIKPNIIKNSGNQKTGS